MCYVVWHNTVYLFFLAKYSVMFTEAYKVLQVCFRSIYDHVFTAKSD